LFNCNKILNDFYDSQVRLSEDEKIKLRDYRDRNIQRVKDGTKKLSEEDNKKYPIFIESFSQGSMAMHTINQAQNNDDQDIDHALIYRPEDVEEDPSDIRELVAKAIAKAGGNFTTDPEARTNAVTVWYTDNYHVDLAIYKKVTDAFGNVKYYHAGKTWEERNPQAITEWFNKSNDDLSPKADSPSTKVRGGQFRRIVRLIKHWAKSRSKWSLPSGLVLTALIRECYRSSQERDDIAFYLIMEIIKERLSYNKEVLNPTDRFKSLLTEDEHHKQILALEKRIKSALGKMQPLLGINCDESKAMKTWGRVFNNAWWSAELKKSTAIGKLFDQSIPFRVAIQYYKKHGSNRIDYDPAGNKIIPKGMKIKFLLTTHLSHDYEISWEVQNSGDEAEWAEQIKPRPGIVDESNHHICNEVSAFRGDHLMICRLIKDDYVYELPMQIRVR